MLSKKILSLGLAGLLSASLLVGCSSEFDSTEYLSDSGKYALEIERKTNREYERLTGLTVLGEVQYKDKYIVATGKVSDTPHIEDNCMLISFDLDGDDNDSSIDLEGNNSPYPIRISIPKTMVDIKFDEGDTITVYGRFAGLRDHRGDKDLKYWQINAYFLELGDTTGKKTTSNVYSTDNKKEVVTEKPSSDKTDSKPEEKKAETKTASNEKKQTEPTDSTPKEDSKKSTQKKSNENTTKEEPSNKHKCWLCKKNITNENFGGYSEDGTMICYKCLNKYGKNEPEEPKEESIYDEYGYDQYGNYDPNKDLYNDREWNDDDYERWDDTHGDEEEDYDDYSEEPIQEADDVE